MEVLGNGDTGSTWGNTEEAGCRSTGSTEHTGSTGDWLNWEYWECSKLETLVALGSGHWWQRGIGIEHWWHWCMAHWERWDSVTGGTGSTGKRSLVALVPQAAHTAPPRMRAALPPLRWRRPLPAASLRQGAWPGGEEAGLLRGPIAAIGRRGPAASTSANGERGCHARAAVGGAVPCRARRHGGGAGHGGGHLHGARQHRRHQVL